MKHILEADGIQLEFNGRKILSSMYLKCETGKITGLLGRNGQGKSCLMNIIYGSQTCEKSVRFDNQSQKSAFKRPDLLVYLPQFNFVPPRLSLERIFADYELDYVEFEKIFPEFALKHKEKIGSLSGGTFRLIELYIILKQQSQFALLDEPFTMLNPIQIEKIKALMLEEKKKKGLLITDHLYNHVLEISDALYLLSNGRVVIANDLADIENVGYAKTSTITLERLVK